MPPVCALVSPLVGGALADQKVAADRLYVWTSLAAGVFLVAAFGCLAAGLNPWWFLILLGLHAIFSGPSWGLLTITALTHLPNVEKQVPLVRVGATLGWMAAGAMTSYLFDADTSVKAGYAAGMARILGIGRRFARCHVGSVRREPVGGKGPRAASHRSQVTFCCRAAPFVDRGRSSLVGRTRTDARGP